MVRADEVVAELCDSYDSIEKNTWRAPRGIGGVLEDEELDLFPAF